MRTYCHITHWLAKGMIHFGITFPLFAFRACASGLLGCRAGTPTFNRAAIHTVIRQHILGNTSLIDFIDLGGWQSVAYSTGSDYRKALNAILHSSRTLVVF
ncbi:hypothetical protein BDBG_17154 [Blastomyces gilchristii SLH14081]|uniref:Uncharacterized protein n=1 Tax=Blastomyces gilchristii (strain SLH14081) TaxID=559298 RepID=A0A179UPZ2_BLAGS|nr:uncharacterized protein BDBG_17154 [Blastomyces gilchristii SLH14081]OAT09091.1 hypothetical protein BDBG_17154 [Blastomyces gilchristii SLH14081]